MVNSTDKYINKGALIAEIEKRLQELRPTNTHKMQTGEKVDRDVLMWLNALTWVKKIIDTLETKEVGKPKESLEKEIEAYWDQCELIWCNDPYSMSCVWSLLSDAAKHFFQVGVNSKHSNVESLFQSLPEKIVDEKSHKVYELSIYHYDDRCVVDYIGELEHDSLYTFSGSTLCEAVENAWNWLLKNSN